ncbi:MAG: TldD/PmbA family protein [Cellulosilyticaceae bacterium]
MNREFKENLFARAKEEGFEAYEIYYLSKANTSVMVSEGEVESHEINSSDTLCFRGIIAGKMGYAYTEKFDEEAVEMLVASAKECALLVEKEDKEIIYTGEESYASISSYDEAVANLDTHAHIAMALELEQKAKEIDKNIFKIAECGIEVATASVSLINSNGVDLSHTQSYISAYVEPVAQDGEAMVNGGEVITVTSLDRLNIDELAEAAVTNTIRKINAKSIPSGKYKAIFENDVMSSLLRAMQSSFFADVMQEGKSLLKGKVGEMIASSKVNLIDNPLLVDGLGSRAFDDEGVGTKEKYIIKDGKFVGFLHNLKTAYKEGVQTTGNASKESIASPVKVDSTNLYIEKGSVNLEELLAKVGNGLYITELEGIHAGANSITGDFSLATRGILIKEGKLANGVKQITIAGNFFELLKTIEEVGNDFKFKGSIGSPSILIAEIAVAGE